MRAARPPRRRCAGAPPVSRRPQGVGPAREPGWARPAASSPTSSSWLPAFPSLACSYDAGQLLLMSLSTELSVLGPPCTYFTMPVQKLPEPTAEGMRSEASNRAVLALSAAVSTFDASANCLLA